MKEMFVQFKSGRTLDVRDICDYVESQDFDVVVVKSKDDKKERHITIFHDSVEYMIVTDDDISDPDEFYMTELDKFDKRPIEKEDKKMKDIPRNHKFVKTNTKERRIKEVMFNGPATIIKWEPSTYDVFVNCNTKGDKTVSVCGKSDIYDKEKGFLLAVIKEFVDNQSYDNILRMMDSFNDEERK